MNIILASQSPRRKEILDFFKLDYTVYSSGFDESLIRFEGDPAKYVMKQSLHKGLSVHSRFKNDLIISADTTVYFDERLYEKPLSEQQAREFLYDLRGQTHLVYTGITVVYQDAVLQDAQETKVSFVDATDAEIELYLKAVYPLDKAAGYAIQGPGSLMIKKIEGCYYNVMGLPVTCLSKLLLRFGVNLWAFAGK